MKRSVDVRLASRVDKDELTAIAHEIHESATGNFERTFIAYYLPGMLVGSGAWATSHFNPDLEVKILGFTESRKKDGREREGSTESSRYLD